MNFNDMLFGFIGFFYILLGFIIFSVLRRVSSEHKKTPKFERKTVEKPWGHEDIWAHTSRYVGKVLHITAGQSLSKQYHKTKDETILVISGKLSLEITEGSKATQNLIMQSGDVYHIAPGVIHRMTAISDCQIAEVSTPELDDVVRLEDKYGRTTER